MAFHHEAPIDNGGVLFTFCVFAKDPTGSDALVFTCVAALCAGFRAKLKWTRCLEKRVLATHEKSAGKACQVRKKERKKESSLPLLWP